MFCSKCGQEVADGQKFCSACGAPVEAPVTPAGATVYSTPAAAKVTGNMDNAFIMGIVKAVGALLIFLSPLFGWLSATMKYDGDKEREHENMFGLAGDDYKIFGFLAVMIMIIGAILILYAVADYVQAIADIRTKLEVIPYFELILIGLVLVFVIIALANKSLNDDIKAAKDMLDMAKEWDSDVKGHVGHGAGPVVAFLGMILSAGPRVLDIVRKN